MVSAAHVLGRVVLVAVLAAYPPDLRAHEDDAPRAGNVSRELIERPLALTDAAGRMHQKVTTSSSKAQSYYDQGIAYLASYAFVHAARSFHEALRLDPALAMAHLQLAKAYGNLHAYAEASRHLARATALAEEHDLGAIERKWIALGTQQQDAVRASADQRQAWHEAYRWAIEELISLDPSDPHAWVLRGNAEEAGAWGRGQAGRLPSAAYYETALRRDPGHLGAHHFLVHSYENVGNHALAAEHGKIYAAGAKGVPHAQHMYGHVLPRLGRWQEALEQFEKADALERAYYAAEGISPEEDWHHGHNLHLLGTVQLRLGNVEAAEALFQRAYRLEARDHFASVRSAPWIEYLLFRGRLDEARVAAEEVEARPSAMARLVGASLGGQALVSLGRVDEATNALQRATKAYADLEEVTQGTFYEPFVPRYSAPFLDTLRGQIALRGKHPEEGETMFLEMADALVANPRIDAWVVGLFHLQRLAEDARRAERPALAAALEERIRRIDPDADLGRFQAAASG